MWLLPVSVGGLLAAVILMAVVAKPETLTIVIALQVTASLFYLLSCYAFQRKEVPKKASLLFVAAVALLPRLALVGLDPLLSADLYRYRWEGKLQAAGGHPYLDRPADARWNYLRDSTYSRIPTPDFKAGYGPLVEMLERGAWRVASAITSDERRQVLFFKLPAAIFDTGILLLLWRLLRDRGVPRSIVWYAWAPLPMVEFWWSGHNDAVALFFVVGALVLANAGRWSTAFGVLGFAAAAKFWPMLLVPAFAGRDGWRWKRPWQWVLTLATFALCALPYWTDRWSDIWNTARFSSGFLGGWRNNDSLFGLTSWLARDPYLAKYATFALAIGFALWFAKWPIERAAMATVASLLLLAANCHPWYLTWFAVLLPFAPWPPLLLWMSLAPLSYQVLFAWQALGVWEGSRPDRWWIYAPVLAWMAASAVARPGSARVAEMRLHG